MCIVQYVLVFSINILDSLDQELVHLSIQVLMD